MSPVIKGESNQTRNQNFDRLSLYSGSVPIAKKFSVLSLKKETFLAEKQLVTASSTAKGSVTGECEGHVSSEIAVINGCHASQ